MGRGAGASTLVNRGQWAVGVAYQANDVVREPGYGSYQAIAPSTGVTPHTDASKWTALALDGIAASGAELGYAEAASVPTTTTVGSPVTVPGMVKTINVAAGQSIYVEVAGILNVATASTGVYIVKDDAGVEVLRCGIAAAAGAVWASIFGRRRITPTAGSRTYTGYIQLNGGTSCSGIIAAAFPVSLKLTAA